MEFNAQPTQDQNQTPQQPQQSQQQASTQQQPSGQVFIKALTGDTISVDYRADLKISELKNIINSQNNVPVVQQRLIFNGKQLDDNNTLDDYGIMPTNVIHLVLRVQGGN